MAAFCLVFSFVLLVNWSGESVLGKEPVEGRNDSFSPFEMVGFDPHGLFKKSDDSYS